jgi:hypothetical protein
MNGSQWLSAPLCGIRTGGQWIKCNLTSNNIFAIISATVPFR